MVGWGGGRWAVQVAAHRGHTVVATARRPPVLPSIARVHPAAADVRDPAALRAVTGSADALLWCVGVTRRSGGDVGRVGLRHLVAAAEELGVDRIVSVSGAAVTVSEEHRGAGARLAGSLSRRFAGDLVTDKQAEHHLVATSNLAWTEVRPSRLTAGPATNQWLLSSTAPGLAARPIPRADVAAAMVHLLEHPDWVHPRPFITITATK